MSECDKCDRDGHSDLEIIIVDDKAFCPHSLTRVWTEEEGEEMSDVEMAEAKKERLKLVRPARPAKYVIIKVRAKQNESAFLLPKAWQSAP